MSIFDNKKTADNTGKKTKLASKKKKVTEETMEEVEETVQEKKSKFGKKATKIQISNEESGVDETESSHKKKKTKKKKTESIAERDVTPLEMYSNMIANKIANGYNEKPSVIPDDQFRTGISTIYTRRFIKKVLILRAYPEYMDEDFNNIVRNVAGNKVTVDIIYSSTPYDPDFSRPHVRRRMRQFANAYERFQKYEKSKSVKDQLFTSDEEMKTISINQQMVRSFQFIKDISKSTSHLACMYIAIELVAMYRLDNSNKFLMDFTTAQKELDEAIKRLKRYAVASGIKFYTPFMNCLEYARGFYPSYADEDSIVKNMVLPAIVNDNTISKFYSYNQGEIKGSGQYIGTDVMTKIPIHKEFTKKTDAQNIFVIGKSGKGKSFYFKTELVYFRGNTYRAVVVDYEGDEYTEIGNFLGAKIIAFGVNNGRYFDTSEIGDLTGIENIDVDLYEEAVHATEHIFDLLIGGENEMTKVQKGIFSDALHEVYISLGVDRTNRDTWKNSKKCSYKKIYDQLKDFIDTDYYQDEYYTVPLKDMYTSLKVYFDENGSKSQMFRNRISVNEIQDSGLVIFSFGMKGANKQTVSKSDIALRQSCVAYLITLYANYNKAMHARNIKIDMELKNNPDLDLTLKENQKVDVGNGFTVVAFEEVQRYWETTGAKSIISDVITGARKRDVIAYLMSNSPMSIINALNSPEAMAVKENITTLMIGRLEEQTATAVAEAFDIKNCIPYLIKIAQNKKYNHCFLAAIDGEEFAIVKAEVKPSIAESPLFKTRNTEETEEDEEENLDYSLDETSSLANLDFREMLSALDKSKSVKA